MLTTDRKQAVRELCPSCNAKGKPVKPITIESLVTEEARARLRRTDGFRFCAEPACEVAYYHPESGAQISKLEVRVRIGQKETTPPRPVCYCFDHTVEEIEAEVAAAGTAAGTSKIADDITAKCRQGLHRCEQTNPQGSCCLGNVRRVIAAAHRQLGQVPTAGGAIGATVASGAPEAADVGAGGNGAVTSACALSPDAPAAEDCCAITDVPPPAAPTPGPRNTGLWATMGAVVSAILSSACCWLPILLIAFGTSAASVAGFFEEYRPVLLGVTALFLASGFYLVYFRKQKCGPGQACALPNPRLKRFNKIMLWVATTVVLAFAAFPNYVGYVLSSGGADAAAPAPVTGESRVFEIEGMTCAGCASGLQAKLQALPGVRAARVDYESRRATVTLDGQGSVGAVLKAIAEQGYQGTAIPQGGSHE